jgi:hypothetical protein
MLSFQKWAVLVETIQYIHLDPEEDWGLGEQAYKLAARVGIRPDSQKNPTILAMDGNRVVGAVFTSWHHDHDESGRWGEPVHQYNFDVVVDPEYRWGRTIGLQLIQQAERERRTLEIEFGEKFYTRLQVINPKLAEFLQGNHKWGGYTPEFKGSEYLVKY